VAISCATSSLRPRRWYACGPRPRQRDRPLVGLGRRAVDAVSRQSIRIRVAGRATRPGELDRVGQRARAGGVEVWPAAEPFSVKTARRIRPARRRADGPAHRAHAKDLLEAQHYTPVNDRPPYDVAGWTLPFTMGPRPLS